MPTLQDKFHELGNWHNKISLASIVTRELLADSEKRRLSREELGKVIAKAVKNLSRMEGFIVGADKTVDGIKPFIYERIGGDTDIPPSVP